MAQFDVNQAIASCKDKTYREVLPLLESLVIGNSHAKAVTTESLATAMHRIASTGAGDPSIISEVLSDRRFQALIHEVENRLRGFPHEFNNQSLANVVWGAGKLRLSQRPELFQAVEREVLNVSKRTLSSFTPQQLAAIAWGFVAAEMTAPRLFYAIQGEARLQPTLDDLLQKAGLLQHLRQRGVQQMANPQAAGMNGGWNQGMGNIPYAVQPVHGTVGTSSLVGGPLGAPIGRAPGYIGGSSAPQTQGGNSVPVLVGPHSPFLGPSHLSQSSYTTHGSNQANSVNSPRTMPSAPHNNGASIPYQQMTGAGGSGASGPPVPAHARYTEVATRPDVAMAAEEHKREMEKKQREMLGDADSEWSCPLCIEPMDDTDISFLPCPCGYQICRLCYHRIVKTETGTCPACRAEYKEENIQKKTPPEKKKKEGEGDVGWETGAGKKKAKEKKAAIPSYAGFPSKVRELLQHCHDIGHVVRGELDERVLDDLKALPERGAIAVLSEFIKKDMSRIRNKCAFLHRIIQRVQQEESQSDKEKCAVAGAGAAGPPPPGSLPPQRSRAVSDVGCARENGGTPAMFTNGGYGGPQASKAIGGWAEKENGGGQFYGLNGGLAAPLDASGDAYRQAGDLISLSSDFGGARSTSVDEYLLSRPSLHLPTAYRQGNAGSGDAGRYREPQAVSGGGSGGGAGAGITLQQINALKLTSGKEALSHAAGAAAGSRLLAMLQGSSQPRNAPAPAPPAYSEDRKPEKPPLFARAGGAAPKEQEAGAPYRGGAVGADNKELMAMIERGENSAGRCGQCGLHKFGDVDTSDGLFYCEDCWRAFESSRGEANLFSVVR